MTSRGNTLCLPVGRATTTPPPTSAAANPINLSQKLDRLLTRYAKNGDFSGVALVAVNGEIVLTKPYDFADVKKQIKQDSETKRLQSG